MTKFSDDLAAFNNALYLFQHKFPRTEWTEEFKNSLLNDYTFFSARIEDDKLQYGDTIRFLNNETVRAINLNSLASVSDHQKVLKSIVDDIDNFELSEQSIKNIHKHLMSNPMAWETELKPWLVGNYRNIPIVGYRQPVFENKEYTPHYNLEMAMASYMDLWNRELNDIDNSTLEKHLMTRIARFHNTFLNELHPFADENGGVCRIVIGAILMKHNCPPVFPEIVTHEQQVEYISTIVQCEKEKNDMPLANYLALGMATYMLKRYKQI